MDVLLVRTIVVLLLDFSGVLTISFFPQTKPAVKH